MACLCASLIAGVAGATEPGARILVSPSWLSEHLQDPSLVVLQVANLRADYDSGHIPGARFLWLTSIAASTPEQSLVMPATKTLERALEQLGVSNDSRVVICHVLGDVTAAARVYVTLDRLGLGDRTSILDGGLEAWKAEGQPLSREVPKYRRGQLSPKVDENVVVDLADVAGRYRNAGVRLVDGRPASSFNAQAGAGVVRGGHIPGAVSLPYSSLVDSTERYLPLDSLRTRFAAASLQPGDEIIAYCQVGRSACPVYVAARMLGFKVRFYDGSFEEWSRHPELPVEGKPAK
jgi:thiosulfate/3-mercaptopyruvate sulfurtransferase